MADNIIKINPNEYTVLDVGCGMRKYEGKEGQRVIGIDKVKTPCVDVVYDIDKGLPFKDKSVDMVYMDNALEHMADFEFQMAGICRVLKEHGEVVIKVPHYSSFRAFTFGHKLFFTVTIMDGFRKNDPMSFMFPNIKFSKVKVRLRTWYMTDKNMKKYPMLKYGYYTLLPVLKLWEGVMNLKPVFYEKFSETISPFTNIFELEFRLKK